MCKFIVKTSGFGDSRESLEAGAAALSNPPLVGAGERFDGCVANRERTVPAIDSLMDR